MWVADDAFEGSRNHRARCEMTERTKNGQSRRTMGLAAFLLLSMAIGTVVAPSDSVGARVKILFGAPDEEESRDFRIFDFEYRLEIPPTTGESAPSELFVPIATDSAAQEILVSTAVAAVTFGVFTLIIVVVVNVLKPLS